MKSNRRLMCAVAVPLAMALATLPSISSAQNVKRSDHYITVLTGPSSGIYFPIGGAFSTLIGKLGYKASATATGATVAASGILSPPRFPLMLVTLARLHPFIASRLCASA